jgi:ubiquinone/menaquinone biosynthesis C-methylase UbiE
VSCCAGLYELPLTEMLLGPSFHPGGEELTAKLASAALVHPAARVLDVASGRGATPALLARRFGCRVTCLDFSEQNLVRSREALHGSRAAARVKYSRGDAERLPFASGSFDIVFCECALCTFPDGARAAAEMRRVLVPRGRLAISDVTLERAVPDELRTVLGTVLCIAGARSVEGYVSLLEEAGFERVHVRDASDALLETVDRVERGIARVRQLAGTGVLELGVELGAVGPVLAAARDFTRAGGIGYTLFTARAPG